MEERKLRGHRPKKWVPNFLRRLEHRKKRVFFFFLIMWSRVRPMARGRAKALRDSQCRANPLTNKCKNTEWGLERDKKRGRQWFQQGQWSLKSTCRFKYKTRRNVVTPQVPQVVLWNPLIRWAHPSSPCTFYRNFWFYTDWEKEILWEDEEKGNTIGPHQLKMQLPLTARYFPLIDENHI